MSCSLANISLLNNCVSRNETKIDRRKNFIKETKFASLCSEKNSLFQYSIFKYICRNAKNYLQTSIHLSNKSFPKSNILPISNKKRIATREDDKSFELKYLQRYNSQEKVNSSLYIKSIDLSNNYYTNLGSKPTSIRTPTPTNMRCRHNVAYKCIQNNQQSHYRSRPRHENKIEISSPKCQICCLSTSSENHSIKCKRNVIGDNYFTAANLLRTIFIILIWLSRFPFGNALLVEPTYVSIADIDLSNENVGNIVIGVNHSIGTRGTLYSKLKPSGSIEPNDSVIVRSASASYGTSSTTKRSIQDGSYVPTLTTIATPLLTTLRYLDKSPHQQQINLHHRNYELDLERDHALPTSAPNADILKSNSNPTYPNPNRHHNHERERHRHFLNSTPLPLLPNILKKNNGNSPTIPMYPGDMPLYSPPARSFFTPPLPPEYQNPFADKPTLRGSNNEGVLTNSGTYINRRPIPPPSLMPGHERIPFRPPDLAASTGGSTGSEINNATVMISQQASNDPDRKNVLNTLLHNNGITTSHRLNSGGDNKKMQIEQTDLLSLKNEGSNDKLSHNTNGGHSSTRKEVLPSIRRILSGEVPEVLLKQATSRPFSYNQSPASPVVLIDSSSQQHHSQADSNLVEAAAAASSNINKSKNLLSGDRMETNMTSVGVKLISSVGVELHSQSKAKLPKNSNEHNSINNGIVSSTPAVASAAAVGDSTMATTTIPNSSIANSNVSSTSTVSPSSSSSSSSSSSAPAAATAHSTWTVAWNIHVYLSVILFTILTVYSLYKMLTYNKLTHLFSQSYFVCIHVILIFICTARIFYLCYDAYNIHSSFHIFVSEILLNLPATFLTTSFAVLILFLFLKSFNHKNNRYSALIRPLTVVVGCGVHVGLCITLHYVESYTLQNHQQQQYLYYQQQQMYRRHQQQHHQYQSHQITQQQLITQHQNTPLNFLSPLTGNNGVTLQQSSGGLAAATTASSMPTTAPPRALSLICQLIYIFICFTLGILYLYLYRILKRILRSKSQNYIHWYQNLSYAIHITIATALLFVLLAALQIFGAISISTNRPLITQGSAEIDWLQWSYQFSLRLIEIAVITLISWVAGLKTSDGSSRGGVGGSTSTSGNGEVRLGGSSSVFGTGISGSGREKQTHHHHHNHSNVTGFFLPCTSSSSQEQFETDYPAVCNANTNLHTYTMRTGKLIYDDSFALNSLASSGGGAGSSGRNGEFQLQQPTYHRPYDTNSLHSSFHQNISEPNTLPGTGGRYNRHDLNQYGEYFTDTATDHYENPNFDLHNSNSGPNVSNKTSTQKFAKTITPSTTVLSSGGSGSSASSQQQVLLLQNDSCYSEPLQPNSCYDFNNFERPKFSENNIGANISSPQNSEHWSGQHLKPLTRTAVEKREKIFHSTMDRLVYENPDKRTSILTQSGNPVLFANSGSNRHASLNSFERGYYHDVRKSGTLNNIIGESGSTCGIIHGRNRSSSSVGSSTGAQTITSELDQHTQYEGSHGIPQRTVRAGINGSGNSLIKSRDNQSDMLERSSLERINSRTLQQQLKQKQQNSDDDMMLSGSNVEHTNLINNEDGSCITNSSSTTLSGGNFTDQGICSNSTNSEQRLLNKVVAQQLQNNNTHSSCSVSSSQSTNYSNSNTNSSNKLQNYNQLNYQQRQQQNHNLVNNSSEHDSAASINSGNSSTASDSATSGSMLVAELGFVRFRALDDINNAQGIGIHNASIRNQSNRAVNVDIVKNN